MTNHSVTDTVRAIGKINLTSAGYSLIPWPWYEHVTITKKNRYGTAVKYPDLLGLSILSYIVFWYTPTIAANEKTHQTDPPRRKFGADKLQCGYQELAERFHASKKQIQQAIGRLKEAGFITVELRTISTKNGVLYNVMFVDLIPTAIARITAHQNQVTNATATKLPIGNLVDDQLVDTYTYASTDASTDIGEGNASSPAGGKAPPAEPPPKTKTASVCKKNGPTTPGSIEFFQQFGRKRWATPQQRETFENTEAEVGTTAMLAAVKWAAENGIARVPAICKTAKKIAKYMERHIGPTSNGGRIPSA